MGKIILSDICMLVVSSPRTKAYLHALIKQGTLPSYVIIMEHPNKKPLPGQLQQDVEQKIAQKNRPASDVSSMPSITLFDAMTPVRTVLETQGIPYEICYATDPNSEEVYSLLQQRPENYVIYSGSGGIIIEERLLSLKKLLHVHPGRLPDYRGSTTIYYSLLNENRCHASSFFLAKDIDAGLILEEEEFPAPIDGMTIDYEYDPYIRAQVLAKTIWRYAQEGAFWEGKKQMSEGETYFIIHPILKHVGILGCGKGI